MTDAALATIACEIGRLRESIARGEVDRAAVVLLIGDKVYLSVKARSEHDAKDYLGQGLLKAFIEGRLATQEEIDGM